MSLYFAYTNNYYITHILNQSLVICNYRPHFGSFLHLPSLPRGGTLGDHVSTPKRSSENQIVELRSE